MTDHDRIAFYERQAEEAYGRMYDAASSSDAAARYSDAKRCTAPPRLRTGWVSRRPPSGSKRGSWRLRPCSACSSRDFCDRDAVDTNQWQAECASWGYGKSMGGLGGTYSGRSDHQPGPRPRIKTSHHPLRRRCRGPRNGCRLAGAGRHNHRAGSARHWRRCLRLLLPPHHHGHNAPAAHKRVRRRRLWPRADERDFQRAGVSGGR
jgi:hypothetical protein